MAKTSKKELIAFLNGISGVNQQQARDIVASLPAFSFEKIIECGKKGDLQKISGIGKKKEDKIVDQTAHHLSQQGSRASQKTKNQKPKSTNGFDELFSDNASPDSQNEREPSRSAKPPNTSNATPKKSTSKGHSKSLVRRLDSRFWCPICHAKKMVRNSETIQCGACKREFPLLHGIADLALSASGQKTGWAQKVMETEFYSQRYEEFMRPKLTRLLTSRTMESEYVLSAQLLDLRESSGVLDVACGTGNYTRYFAKLVESHVPIVGVDLSWPMLKKAKEYVGEEKIENISYLRADATRLPFADASFDRVHCSGALYLIPDVDAALREFYRVCEPGALLVVGAFTQSANPALRFLKNMSASLIQLRFFDEEELIERIEKVGFRVINENAEGDAITIKALRKY